jgi:hypothetical protein
MLHPTRDFSTDRPRAWSMRRGVAFITTHQDRIATKPPHQRAHGAQRLPLRDRGVRPCQRPTDFKQLLRLHRGVRGEQRDARVLQRQGSARAVEHRRVQAEARHAHV